MSDQSILRITDLRQKSDVELAEMAEKSGVEISPEGVSRESLIKKLVTNSYTVQQLPTLRESRRGIVILGFLEEDGTPRTEGTKLSELVDELVERFDMDPTNAEATVKLYKRDLVKYYGMDIVSDNGDVVRFTDERRQAWLSHQNSSK